MRGFIERIKTVVPVAFVFLVILNALPAQCQEVKKKTLYYDDTKIKYGEGKVRLEPPEGFEYQIGNWTFYYENGSVLSRGEFGQNGTRIGNWNFNYKNGSVLARGGFGQDGNVVGKWTFYYPNGNLFLEAQYKNQPVNLTYEGRASGEKVQLPFCEGEVLMYWDDGKKATKFVVKGGKIDETVILNTRQYEEYDKVTGELTKLEKALTRLKMCEEFTENIPIDTDSEIEFLSPGRDLDDIIKNQSINGEGEKHGSHITYNKEGKVTYVTNYDRGFLDGEQKEYYDNGKVQLIKNWVRNTLDGEQVEYYQNGNLKKRENYSGSFLQGVSEAYSEDGQPQYKGNYLRDKKHGKFEIYKAGKLDLIENYNEGTLSGEYFSYFSNGKTRSKGNYTKGVASGRWEYYRTNGSLSSVENKNAAGNTDGEVVFYGPNNQVIDKSIYKNGNFESKLVCYDLQGKEILTNGTGKAIGYFDSGKTKFEIFFKNGKHHGTYHLYYESGKMEYSTNMINGCREGLTVWYYDNGQIEQSALYKYDPSQPDGLRWEIVSSFKRDGTSREKGSLKDGNGTWLTYDEVGELKKISRFTNGLPSN